MSHARIVLLLVGYLATNGCSSSPPAPQTTWLAIDPQARGAQVERHLRGFDMAMMEVGHRYIDLYWAGQDGNWEAAAYQLEKIRLAIENGLERWPNRAVSARPFLEGPLAAMDEPVAGRDAKLFASRAGPRTPGRRSRGAPRGGVHGGG